MAKNSITPDVLETILLRVTDKFSEALNNILKQFSQLLNDTMNDKLAAINDRLVNIESRIDQRNTIAASANVSTITSDNVAINTPGQPLSTIIEATSRTLLEFEREKEELRKRSKNVIITGLPKQTDIPDLELVELFCEQNLTVKPHVAVTRRIGKNRSDPSAKLCVTLESEDAVDALLSSAALLRSSSNASVNRVFFNRDLTRSQAEAAFKMRCEKRAKKGASESSSSDTTTSATFPVTS